MARLARLSALVCIAALAAAGASAQSSQPARSAEDTITVRGKHPPDEDMIRSVIAPFVERHAARDRKSGLLVREPASGLCPVTLGLPPEFKAFVTARIVAVAKDVGAAVQDSGKCHPNVEVVFTVNPQTLVNALAKRTRGEVLGMHFVGETAALVHVLRPIQAWYVTGTADDPTANAHRVDPDGTITPPGQVAEDRAYGQSPFTGTGSHIRPRNSSLFMNVLIVADVGKLAGHEIGPVSDYVAMMALSQAASLDACTGLPSILDLMASGCSDRPKPEAVTDGDRAFLKALYAADITTSVATGREQVEHRMAEHLGPDH